MTAFEISERVFRRKERIVTREVAGETLLVPVAGTLADMQRIFVLEGTGEFLWERLDGTRTVGILCGQVVEHFDVSEETALADVVRFLDELREAELIEAVE